MLLQPKAQLAFLAGQWVNLLIPGLAAVGGFTITSTPRQLHEGGTFQLAVKRSRALPAAWLHERVGGSQLAGGMEVQGAWNSCFCMRLHACTRWPGLPELRQRTSSPGLQARVGDRLAASVGGNFHYRPGDERRPLLLVAGGVGINPLFSILQHCCELSQAGAGAGDQRSGGSGGGSGMPQDHVSSGIQPAAAASRRCRHRRLPHAAVLYSASVPAELAFRRELQEMRQQAHGSIRLQLHVTAPEWRGRCKEWGGHWGRIGRPELQAALRWLARPRPPGSGSGPDGSASRSSPACQLATALVCGHAAMKDAMVADLLALGLTTEQIRFERWW